jgi:predicted PurR-regulated permease PerM
LLLAAVLVLFLAMVYEIVFRAHEPGEAGYLSPIGLAFVGTLLLWPIRTHRASRTVLLTGGLLLVMWSMVALQAVLIPFALVYLLAYLLNPLVTFAHARFKVPRFASALASTLFVLGIFAFFALELVPSFLGQLEVLAERLLSAVGGAQVWLETSPLLDPLDERGLVDRATLGAQLADAVQAQVAMFTSDLPGTAQGLLGYLGSALGAITLLAVVPVVYYYLLKDFPVISARLVDLFPTVGGERGYLVQASRVVGGYLRGQIIISLIAAFNVTVALWLFDVPFALIMGFLTGILNLIPNLGALITALIGVLLSLLFGDPVVLTMLIVLGVFFAQNILESSVLTPLIMSNQVGLHPVLILLALFIFGFFLGLFGLIIAVPVTALVMTAFKAHRNELKLDLAPEARLKRDLTRRLLSRFQNEDS